MPLTMGTCLPGQQRADAPAQLKGSPVRRNSKFLVISRHDYRSRRKANVHFIARELAKLGTTRFFSTNFSLLSRLTHDQRLPLWSRANRVERLDGVEAFLWRTLAHPCKAPKFLDGAMDRFFRSYAERAPATLRAWIAEADTVLLESGGPEIFFDLVRRHNPACRIGYIASDALETIGSARYVVEEFRRVAPRFDAAFLPSKLLAHAFPPGCKLHFVPHGVDAGLLQASGASPYKGGVNIVSVGDMLFDPGFFEAAAPAFPGVGFHVIGGGKGAGRLAAPNVAVYPETPFKDTLAFLKHADAGVAPYAGDKAPAYLEHTSMKLMQYGHLGLPAICPATVAGGHRGRFGYAPGNPASIAQAVRDALSFGRFKGLDVLSWAEVTERILVPEDFPDTALD